MDPQPVQSLSEPSITPMPSSTAPTPPPEGHKPTWRLWVLGIIVVAVISSAATYLLLGTKTTQQQVTTPTISVSPSATLDSTANWKSYVSSRAPYSFKYPDQQWPLIDFTSSTRGIVEALEFSPVDNPDSGDSTLGVIFVFKESDVKSIDDYVSIHVNGDKSKVDLQYTTVGGERAVSYKLSGGIPPLPIIEYAVVKKGYYYTIRIDDSVETNKNREANMKIFDQILSTFKFL